MYTLYRRVIGNLRLAGRVVKWNVLMITVGDPIKLICEKSLKLFECCMLSVSSVSRESFLLYG